MIRSSKLKKCILVAGVIMLGINCVSLYKSNQEIAALRNEINSMHFVLREMENQNNANYSTVEEMLRKQQSMFTSTAVDMKLKGNKIEIIMQAVPKQINNNEKLIAKVIANGHEYEQEVNENNEASLTVEITDTITPVFIIRSENGIRQEALEEMYPSNVFTSSVTSDWVDVDPEMKKLLLNAWVDGDFKKEDIVKAEFIVVDTGITLAANESYSSSSYSSSEGRTFPSEDIEGTIITAKEIQGKDGKTLGYSGDFVAYVEDRNGVVYDVYFSLTTQDGMKYITPDNSLATFCISAGGTSVGSGDSVILLPIVK